MDRGVGPPHKDCEVEVVCQTQEALEVQVGCFEIGPSLEDLHADCTTHHLSPPRPAGGLLTSLEWLAIVLLTRSPFPSPPYDLLSLFVVRNTNWNLRRVGM
jgi:hypothetical protein